MEQELIHSVIRVVSENGIENTTIKKIAASAKVTASGIYGYYQDKDDLLQASFLWADDFFASNVRQIYRQRLPEDSLQRLWKRCFFFMLDFRDETMFYVRFLYSTLFSKELMEKHIRNFSRISTVLFSFVNDGSSTESVDKQFLLDHVLNNTLIYAEKIISGKIEMTEETVDRIWNVICGAVQSCIDCPQDTDVPAKT